MIENEQQMFQVWSAHPFAERELNTSDGMPLRILSPGILNRDSGPDFFDARIELNGQVWSGNVEMHVRASDWMKHGHTTDKAFSNVILHVVCVNDCEILDDHGNVIPVLVLSDELLSSHSQAGNEISSSANRRRRTNAGQSLESLGVERLLRRSGELKGELNHLKGDTEVLFQRHLFRRFGMRTNSEPFQQLAHCVPLNVIRRQRTSLMDIESILFGQSALLPEIPVDGYSAELLYRYTNFRLKYSLEPMFPQAWKFMRMRPSNFPTIRISQLSMLLNREDHLFARCMNPETTVADLRRILDVTASEYWDEHFRFGIPSGHHVKQMGEEAIDSILINTVATIRYFLGVERDDDNLKDSAVELLRKIAPENNAMTRQSGRKPSNALQSQGLLELLTSSGESKLDNDCVREFDFDYFSITNHERNQNSRQNCNLVRNQSVRCM